MPEHYCRREKLFDFLQRHTFSIASVLGILVVIKIDLFGSAFLHCPMGMVEEKVSSRLVIGPGALLMGAVAPILIVGAVCFLVNVMVTPSNGFVGAVPFTGSHM